MLNCLIDFIVTVDYTAYLVSIAIKSLKARHIVFLVSCLIF